MRNNLLSLVNNYVQDRTHEAFSNLINHTIRLNKYFYKEVKIQYVMQVKCKDERQINIMFFDEKDSIEEIIKEYKDKVPQLTFPEQDVRLVKITTEVVNCDEN